jgi:hypothetical protein
LSFLTRSTRLRHPPAEEPTTAGDDASDRRDDAGHQSLSSRRIVAAWVTTALAGLLVLFALVAPNQIGRLTPGAFLRIPVEGLLGVALLLVLPGRARRIVAVLAGVALGVLTILKIVDMGFYAVLARPFDLVLDWSLLGDAMGFLTGSMGRVGGIATMVAVELLAISVIALTTLSVLRLTRLAARRKDITARAVAVLATVWVACAMLGAQIVPGAPVASGSAADLVYHRALDVRVGLHDQQAFTAEAGVDAFRDTPGKDLLSALRGKDVIVAFVESYGRSAIADPEYASQVGAVLDAGNRQLRAAGYASQSAFLTSPTVGGGSWLAHATFLSGLWISNQQRFRTLVSSDRLTLGGAFQRASWRTAVVMPGTTRAWPEGAFFGYDWIYAARDLGYRGPKYPLATMPDQYTLSAFERLKPQTPDHLPLMAAIELTSSHAPWAPVPRLIGWDQIGDGSVFGPLAREGDQPADVYRNPARMRAAYGRAIAYSLNTLISYVKTYGDDDLVLVFLGDHQPAPGITGEGASRDVPITIVTRDRAVLDRISGWGWQDGLKPGPQAPVWRMSAFRDRFLTAFASHPPALGR